MDAQELLQAIINGGLIIWVLFQMRMNRLLWKTIDSLESRVPGAIDRGTQVLWNRVARLEREVQKDDSQKEA